MAAPSGGIPKHERVLVLLDIIKSMGTAEFDMLSIRFSSRAGAELTLALKRALYRDLKELVQENRLDEIKIDSKGDVIEQDPDLNPIIAKSAWRIRDAAEVENFWGESVLKKEGIVVSGSSFLVSALSAQVSMDTSDRRHSYLLFGTQNNLVLRLPKDLAPFVIVFGRAKKDEVGAFVSDSATQTGIAIQSELPKPITRELHVYLPHHSVSRRHCSIKFDTDQSTSIIDFGSSNYTRVVSNELSTETREKTWSTGEGWDKGTANIAAAISSAIFLGPGLPLKISKEAMINCGNYPFVFIP
jgi:hypothetical protein